MGKAERIRRMNARERIIAQQAAAQRAEARKRMFLAAGSVLGVLAIVIVLIVIKSANNGSASTGPAAAQNEAATLTRELNTVPAATLNSVGKGTDVSALKATTGQAELTSAGKPEILFMGEESCPYCGAERWAMTIALSRFGTFSNLHFIHSSSTDVYPNTPTLTYYQSTYTSKYLAFDPVEMYTVKGAALMKPTAAETALMAKYDASGYFPFLDIGNQYLDIGAQYLPSTLAKLTWAEVAADIRNPSSAVAQGVDGTANSITAAICKIAKTTPAGVCTSAGVKAAAGSL